MTLHLTVPDLSAPGVAEIGGEHHPSPRPQRPSPWPAPQALPPSGARGGRPELYAVDPRRSRLRDLTYSSALLDVVERVQDAPDLASLFSAVTAEAATIVPSDDVMITRLTGLRRLAEVHIPTHLDHPESFATLGAAAAEPWLVEPGHLPDLWLDPRWSDRPAALRASPWRSALTTTLTSPTRHDVIRLSWFSTEPGSFDHLEDVVAIFARYAELALRTWSERDNLTRAIAARHRVGQAQGILMAGHRVTADEAFQLLVHRSQHTNVKLSVVADRIIARVQSPVSDPLAKDPGA